MKPLVDCSSESEHLGVFVYTGTSGMSGPFLVPIVEFALVHMHRMHYLGGF